MQGNNSGPPPIGFSTVVSSSTPRKPGLHSTSAMSSYPSVHPVQSTTPYPNVYQSSNTVVAITHRSPTKKVAQTSYPSLMQPMAVPVNSQSQSGNLVASHETSSQSGQPMTENVPNQKPIDPIAPYKPPRQPENRAQPKNQNLTSPPIDKLSESDVKTALIEYSKNRKFFQRSYNAKEIEKMKIESIQPNICHYYVLETFYDSRQTSTQCEKLSNKMAPSGPTLNIMEYKIFPDNDFVEQEKFIELPGTSHIKPCHNCNGSGRYNCSGCSGTGKIRCTDCRGTGFVAVKPCAHNHSECSCCHHQQPCIRCRVQGTVNCQKCNGTGKLSCKTCAGKGSMRHFKVLHVNFLLDKSEFYSSQEIPQKKLMKASAELLLSDINVMVQPVQNFPSINEISQRLVHEHGLKSNSYCRILKQRHRVEAIPVTKVQYTLGKYGGQFWVYGKERLCYIRKDDKKEKCTLS